MQYKRNDKISLEVSDMTKEGLGLAKVAGQVFFVKDALIGDKVNAVITKLTTNVIYAKALDIEVTSPYRVESKCKISNSCGGCQLLNLKYEKQLELKKNNVLNAITKIGKFDAIDSGKKNDKPIYEGIISSNNPYNFRNKMQVPFAKRDNRIVYGFYAGRTHYIVENDNCIAGFKNANGILDIVKEAIDKYDLSVYNEEKNTGVFREVLLRKGNTSDEISITYILNDKNYKSNLELYKSFDSFIREKVSQIVTSTININTNANNVLFGNTNIVLYGSGHINDSIGDIKFQISPESFYQVNIEMTRKLYDKVLEYANLSGDENVLDLYCGIGTISLYIARFAKKVKGIEIVEKAIENAINNARLNNIDNVEFICDDVSRVKAQEEIDVVVVDPPRKGLDINTIDYITNIEPKRIVYVSCDPATLARDLDIICNKDNKYKLVKFANVDMFPHTMHVETVALIEKVR